MNSKMQQSMKFLAVVFLGLPLLGSAQSLDGVLNSASADLQKVTVELTAARAEVEAARLPLARKVSELEQTLLNRRAELAKLQRFQENQLVELNALKTEAKRLSDEVKYTDSLVTEYARAFRSRLNFVEEPRYAARSADAPDLSTPSSIAA
jgi:septal ring factor EnvC (AmiA/AmiB activator)